MFWLELRILTRLHTPITALACLLAIAAAAECQSPRTPDGHPDFQGTWTNVTLTPLERPAEFAGKPTVSDQEALAYEKRDHGVFEERPDLTGAALARVKDGNAVGAEDSEIWEKGTALARVSGKKRTSLIVDPPDGKVPGLTPEGSKRLAAANKRHDRPATAQDLMLKDRCLSYGPLPMLPQVYNGNYQIVQTPGHVMILGEMLHDARIIRMNATHAPPAVRQWLGDSIGHWEGDMLVIDTTNFNSQIEFRGSTENLHVVERLSRTGPGSLLYRATIDDPAAFTKAWTIEYPLVPSTGRIFEYACHEGNLWVQSALSGK